MVVFYSSVISYFFPYSISFDELESITPENETPISVTGNVLFSLNVERIDRFILKGHIYVTLKGGGNEGKRGDNHEEERQHDKGDSKSDSS